MGQGGIVSGLPFLVGRRGPGIKKKIFRFEPIKYHCYPHIGTNQLICTANQLTCFNIRATLAFNGLSRRKKQGKDTSQLAIRNFSDIGKHMNTLCVFYFYVVFLKNQNISSTFL